MSSPGQRPPEVTTSDDADGGSAGDVASDADGAGDASDADGAGDGDTASPWPDDPRTEQKLLRLADEGYLTESEVERLVAGLNRGDDGTVSGKAGDDEGSGEASHDGTVSGEVDDDGSDEPVAGAGPERVAALESTVERLREAVEEREQRLQAKREEVDDYIQTQEARLDERRRRLTADLVSGLLADVYGPLGRALDASDADALREGVALTRSNFEAVLADQDVTILAPEPGTDLDRDRHTVERTVPADAPPETVVELHDPGFTVEGEVIEKASVYVAE